MRRPLKKLVREVRGREPEGNVGRLCEVPCEDGKGVSPVDLDSARGLHSLADAQ